MKTPYDVIIKPVISERSMDIAPDKKYTFKVAVDANKTEVKQAVEEIQCYEHGRKAQENGKNRRQKSSL